MNSLVTELDLAFVFIWLQTLVRWYQWWGLFILFYMCLFLYIFLIYQCVSSIIFSGTKYLIFTRKKKKLEKESGELIKKGSADYINIWAWVKRVLASKSKPNKRVWRKWSKRFSWSIYLLTHIDKESEVHLKHRSMQVRWLHICANCIMIIYTDSE